MKPRIISIVLLFIMATQVNFGQWIEPILNNYYTYESSQPKKVDEYKDIEGNPYLDSTFKAGIIYLKDSIAYKLPLRYNIYADQMEYRQKEVSYIIENPQLFNMVKLNGSIFVYLPFLDKGGYFELAESGKCSLLQKRLVGYQPAEGPKPVTMIVNPAKFYRQTDVFYIIRNNKDFYKIKYMNSVIEALKDQEEKIENYIKQEKIKSTNKENLIKIVNYYNNL